MEKDGQLNHEVESCLKVEKKSMPCSPERDLVEEINNEHSSYQGWSLVCGHAHSCAGLGVGKRQEELCAYFL